MLQPFALSYVNVNMAIYLVIIPLVWAFIVDRKLRSGILLVSIYVIVLIAVALFNWLPITHYFNGLTNFVKYMQGVHHCTYAESCVIWCMEVPLVITIILIAIPRRAKRSDNPGMMRGLFNRVEKKRDLFSLAFGFRYYHHSM